MKKMHLLLVCHVIFTLNLTKDSFCYFKHSWVKSKEKSVQSQYINQNIRTKTVIWINTPRPDLEDP